MVKKTKAFGAIVGFRRTSGYNSQTLTNPGQARQYDMAPRPGFGGFDRVSKLCPEDILRPSVDE